MVPKTYPGRSDFEMITAEGEAAGLYDTPRRIGFRKNWESLVSSKGYELVEGRLFRSSALPSVGEVHIERDRTAISRVQFSAPMQILSRFGYLEGQHSVCDYGCGRGDDLAILESLGVDAVGWDPNHRPEGERLPSDIVNLGYVINVIEDREERDDALRSAYALARRLLVVSAMIATDAHIAKFKTYKDGVITSRKTFQKYYDQGELKEYVDRTLGVQALPAASGLFLVFRDEELEAEYRFAQYGRKNRERQRGHRQAKAEKLRLLIEEHDDVCEQYWNASLLRGRWLTAREYDRCTDLIEIFGSTRKAQRALLEVYDEVELREAEKCREEDILFGQAMSYFQGRAPFSHLPEALQTDIRYYFGSYRELQARSRELLNSLTDTGRIESACLELAGGKLPVHLDELKSLTLSTNLIGELPLALRSYIGCAEQLIGDVGQFDLLKIHIHTGKVSVMSYDGFDKQPLPKLIERIKVDLWNQRVYYYDYVDEFKPRPLYRRSMFMTDSHSGYRKQCSFDKRLDELGLAPESPHAGFSFDQLREILEHKGLEVRGHRFYRTKSKQNA